MFHRSVIDGIHLFSMVSVVEDLADDWLKLDKHSRHTLSVHGFLTFTVSLVHTCQISTSIRTRKH